MVCEYRGLLIDWGGVLTTDVFASFGAFCELEGIEWHEMDRLFRQDAECRELIHGLETGSVAQEQFEPRMAALLGVDAPGLIHLLFDTVVISGEVGLRKPHRAMYALAAERIGLGPAECVFVDDLGVNLASAAKLGMAAVHHRDADHTIPELERLLGVDLR